jgi:signal transduction histidine kinase
MEDFLKLKYENERLKNFSYIVSHNLKSYSNNMKAIFGYLEEEDILEEDRREMISHLREIAFSLDETLFQLERIMAVEQNPELEKISLDLADWVQKELVVFQKEVERKNAQIQIDIPSGFRIFCNPGYLSSVVHNFLSNALKYSHKERAPKVIIRVFSSDGYDLFEVEDNGIGIDLNRFGDQIFGLFKTFYKRPDSKGLGLYISKIQVEAMGGSVYVFSEPGVGSRFGARFPQKI